VAAASIVAKVTRDRIMKDLSHEYPEYGFSRHKGYSTPSHMAALTEHGPCPQHRASFANVIGVMRARAGGPADAVADLAAEEAAPLADIEAFPGSETGEPAGAGAELSYG
jgi:ribonuclease HII